MPSLYPDATNTGVPAGLRLAPSGGKTITTAGTVLNGLNITGMVDIRASNVTIENCKISADAYAQIVVEAGLTGITIKNCEVYGGGLSGVNNAGSLGIYIKGGGVTVENCNIHGAANGISLLSGPATIINNYIHDLSAGGGGNHYNGIQFNGGGSGGAIDIEHNTIINQNIQTDAIMLDNEFGAVRNVTVNNNILMGGSYTVYADGRFTSNPITNVSFTNNHLGGGYYGDKDFPNSSPIYTGNVDDAAAMLRAQRINVNPAAPHVVGITFQRTGTMRRKVTVTFNKPVANFDASDVFVPRGSVGKISGSGTTWTVNVGQVMSNRSAFVVRTSGVSGASWTDAAGNNGVGTAQGVNIKPAGTSGEAINLGLADMAGGHGGAMDLVISGVPAGWSLSEGIDEGGGVWKVRTADVAALSMTSPAGATGAVVLDVRESWTNPDGSAGGAEVADNVEAYAKGAPIFAWSGEDHLTGSSGKDLFVFTKTIGEDTIRSFDVAQDRIDLVGEAGFASFADVEAHLSSDASGNAKIAIGSGQSITLVGVAAASLTAANFVFDETPFTQNVGTLTIGDGALMPFGGVIDNQGTIGLASQGHASDLEILGEGAKLQGGGKIVLSDNGGNVIYGASASATLTNVDNTISGAGRIGDGAMSLVNQGVIEADGTNGLVIDTGANAVVNSGVLSATGPGGLTIEGAIVNSGRVLADGGDVTIKGSATGPGSATIAGSSTLEYDGASSQATSFAAGASGVLRLAQSSAFTGTVAGFSLGDSLDLLDIGFGAHTTLGYSQNSAGTGGSLTISDGAHSATISLLGQYSAAGFQTASDQHGGAIVTYSEPTASQDHPVFSARTAT